MRKPILLALLLLAGFASKSQNIITEGFNTTSITTTMPTGWTTVGTGTNLGFNTVVTWQLTPTGGFGAANGNQPNPAPHGGTGMAGYESWYISNGSTSELRSPSFSLSYPSGTNVVSFWVYNYRDPVFPFNATDKIETYVNTTATSTGGSLLGTVVPSSTATTTTSWVQYTYTIPSSYSGATNYIIFKATSAYGYDMFLDDFEVNHLVPCTGTPVAGTASATPNPVCPNKPFTLNATGYSIAGNLTFQWQSSPAGAGTWTNITGATLPFYTVASLSAATDYRFRVTCTNSSTTSTSNTVSVTLNSYTNCYCIPTYQYGCIFGTDINSYTLVGANSTGISQLNNPCPSSNSFTNYTSLTPVLLYTGSSPGGIINTSSYNYVDASIYIDYNNDGIFGTGIENVYNSYAASLFSGIAVAPSTSSYSLSTIPAINGTTVLAGLHRMRVRTALYNFGTVDPCIDLSEGEARDYMVYILSTTPPPPVRVSATDTLCRFDALNITVRDSVTGYPGRTFTLSGPHPSLPITNTTGIFTVPGMQPGNSGTYNVTVTYGTGVNISAPRVFNIVVYATPTISISNITSPTTCTGTNGSLQIDGLTPNTTYTLSYRRNTVNVPAFSITANAGGSYVLGNLSVAAYDSIRVQTAAPQNCYSNTIVAPQSVPALTPPATPIVSHQTPLCNNGTLRLSVTNPVTGGLYSWTGTPGFVPQSGINLTSVTRPNMTSANNGNYYVTVTINGCQSVAGRDSVVVSPPDAAPNTSGSNITYCQYDNAVPLTAVGVNLLWYYTLNPTEVGSASITPVTTAVADPPTSPSLIYYVTQTGTCESPRTPVFVRVKPRPLPPAIASTTIQYCQYETVGPISVTGTAVRWYATLTGGLGSVTPPTPVTLIPGTFFYYATQTVNGCESERLIITVIIKPKPEPPGVTSPLNLCQGDPITPLTAVGQSLLWYTIPSGGVGVPVAPLINTGYEDSFFYYVTQTVNGCESDRALLAAYVRYKPNGIITANSQWVCQDEVLTFNYYGNGRPDAEYVWFAPLSAQFVSGQGTPGPVVIHFDTAGTSVVQLTINNKGCISNLIAAPITVRPLPKLSFINRQDVCEDELLTISLNGMTPDISGYHWAFGSDAAILEYGETTTGGPFGIRYPSAGHYQVSATATLNMCTSKPIYQEVYVHARPDASITSTPSPIDICASDTLFLSVRRVEEGATYTWTPNAYFQGKHDTLNNQVFAVVSRSSEVKVYVKTAYGCEAEDSVKVTTKPCCGVYFPNAFAPGGNVDRNRLFRPITNGVHKINTFRVINRWGQVVYESKVERNGWDGTLNGTPQDMGTYFYYISYKCEGKDMEDHGEVLLLR